jgi:uncharacterized protein YcbK (DUF882 family)
MGDTVNRRQVIKWILSGLTIPIIPGVVENVFAAKNSRNRSGKLSLYHVHTHDSIDVRYMNDQGLFDPTALKKLDDFFRCRFTNKVHTIDPALFYWMDVIKTRLGASNSTYHLYSGYRSPEYNRYLRRKSRRVAKKSYHLRGMAADVRLENVGLNRLKREARRLSFGGVSRYGRFVHIDVGPCRTW